MTHAGRPAILRYGVGLLLFGLVFFALAWLRSTAGVATSPFPALLIVVLFSVWYGGVGPGLAVTTLAALVTVGLLASPSQFSFARAFDPAQLVVFVITAVVLSVLIATLSADRPSISGQQPMGFLHAPPDTARRGKGTLAHVRAGTAALLSQPDRWRLRTRLTVTVVALLLPLQQIVIATYQDNAEERRSREIQNAVLVSQTVAGLVDGFARDLEGVALATSVTLGTQGGELDQESVGPVLQTLFSQYDLLRALFVTDPGGRVLASDSGIGIGVDVSERPYIRALKGGAERVWSDGLMGLESGEITIAFGRAIRRADGSTRGFLVAALYPERLSERLPPSLPPDAEVTFIDSRGAIVFTSNPNARIQRLHDASQAPGVQEALAGKLTPVVGAATPYGQEERYGALVSVPRTGWAIAYTEPQAVLEMALRTRFVYGAAAITAVIMFALVLVALITRRLAQPLAELSATAAAITRGEHPEFATTAADPEISQLARAMQGMSAATARREETARFLADASTILSSSLDYEVTLARIAGLAVPNLADFCIVDMVEHDGSIRRLAVAHVDPSREQLARELQGHVPAVQAPTGAAKVMRTGEPEIAANLTDEDLGSMASNPEHLRILRLLAPRSHMIVPLAARGRTIGAITFGAAESGRLYTVADLAVAIDLAHRAAMAVDNARLYREAEDSVRMRDEFLGSVSHDLKTPLASIKGISQLLQRQLSRSGTLDVEKTSEWLASIDETSNKMVALIGELLDLARAQIGQPIELDRQPTDLVALAAQTIKDYQGRTDRHALRLETAIPSLVGEWDPVRLERALNNLVGNAIKYSPDGGPVSVSIVLEESDSEGKKAILKVKDQGLGIPPADLTQIFDRFHRANNVAGRISGTGIGLTSTRQIVEQHGGRVTVESQVGVGSTFSITLPLEAPATDGHQR